MTITGVKLNDILRIDRKGRRFEAFYRGRENDGTLIIKPLDSRISYRTAKAVEVIGIWRATTATRRRWTDGT